MSPVQSVPMQSIVFMILSLLISLALPIVLTVHFCRKYDISIIAVFVGALVFFVVQFVLRISILLPIVQKTAWYGQLSNWLALFLFSFSAALFEEPGRYIGFKLFLKNRLSWKNGIAYGIGHGGIEAVLLVGLTNVNNLVLSFMINSGVFDKSIGPLLPGEEAEYLKNILVSTPPGHFLLGGIERVFAIAVHIALSLLVISAVKKRKYLYLVAAIVLHTLLNFIAVLLARINVFLPEGFLLIAAIAAVYYAVKSREHIDVDKPYPKEV